MPLQNDDQEMFYAMLAIPWLTLLMAPKATVKRWGTSSPVSEPTMKQWKVRREASVAAPIPPHLPAACSAPALRNQ